MRILLACEESQSVCLEMRKKGHEAFSADIMECSGPHPEWHIKGDVLEIINDDWDMMIAFPPCTHLAVSGARHFEQKRRDGRQQQGIDFFMKMAEANIPKIAIENPIGIMSTHYKKPSQIIHPYHFGDPYSKATCLWLKNLPLLNYNRKNNIIIDGGLQKEIIFSELPTEVDKGEFVTFSSGKRMAKWYNEASGNGHLRSKTFPGIAKAMADQWG
jgi:site-specific DNA-cytosine methylase